MLEGKIALVTGASRGIGRQIALTLGREGASVIVNYNGSAAKAEEVVKEIEAAGGKAEAVQCNVSDFESCGRMMADVVSRYGRLDILVNNAGITRDNLLMKMSEEDFDAVISTNLKGVFNCIKHISRQMLKQKAGRIINISSVSGVLGNAGQANYCAAKAGVIGITKSAARELAQGNHGKCSGSWFHCNGDDRCSQRQRKGSCHGADSNETFRKYPGHCRDSCFPGF